MHIYVDEKEFHRFHSLLWHILYWEMFCSLSRRTASGIISFDFETRNVMMISDTRRGPFRKYDFQETSFFFLVHIAKAVAGISTCPGDREWRHSCGWSAWNEDHVYMCGREAGRKVDRLMLATQNTGPFHWVRLFLFPSLVSRNSIRCFSFTGNSTWGSYFYYNSPTGGKSHSPWLPVSNDTKQKKGCKSRLPSVTAEPEISTPIPTTKGDLLGAQSWYNFAYIPYLLSLSPTSVLSLS